MEATSTSDPYRVLGVDRAAGDAAIAAAHRKLARQYHPDVAGDDATAEMMRINAAFDRIRDRRRRAAWAAIESQERAEGRGPATTGPDVTRSSAAHSQAQASPRSADGSGVGGLDWTPERDGTGGAGPPPGRPSGTVLTFGRHIGWSLGEIARADPGYLVWLEDRHEGRPLLDEIDRTLRQSGYRKDSDPGPARKDRFHR